MRVIRDNLQLCEDCTCMACDGDISGFDFHQIEAMASAKLDVIAAGLTRLGPNLVPDFNSETNEGIEEFSNAPCACCDSHLVSSRHRFAILGE
jgi:hypothetical protein